ncbi:hypothetical protein J6590_002297 [Homalodisca vitripennis]|nr:hypothetical protein J6590_002297 [Homalodisca vitripennis]
MRTSLLMWNRTESGEAGCVIYLTPPSKVAEYRAVRIIFHIPISIACCFFSCTFAGSCFEDYKEFIDAESLMPLATSDFKNPICLEMKLLRSGRGLELAGGVGGGLLGMGGGVMDVGSVDSSDTYASCNTQPFNSQGDLTETPCDPLDSNLYINPLESPSPRGGVKKSASGDTALRSLGASPLEEAYRGFGAPERGSRGSLNDTPLPKHRKTRFQQVLGSSLEIQEFRLKAIITHLDGYNRIDL